MLYEITEQGRKALKDDTFVTKDAKGRKSVAQWGRVAEAVAATQPSATKAAIVKAARFKSKSAASKANAVGFYLVKLKKAKFVKGVR